MWLCEGVKDEEEDENNGFSTRSGVGIREGIKGWGLGLGLASASRALAVDDVDGIGSEGDEEFWKTMEIIYGKDCNDIVHACRAERPEAKDE